MDKNQGPAVPHRPHRRADSTLDASRVVFPFSLVLCKAALERLAPGQILAVLVSSRPTLEDLVTILSRGGNIILGWEAHGSGFRLWVQKGGPTTLP
jgi:TusA-related sulfurtransferase